MLFVCLETNKKKDRVEMRHNIGAVLARPVCECFNLQSLLPNANVAVFVVVVVAVPFRSIEIPEMTRRVAMYLVACRSGLCR